MGPLEIAVTGMGLVTPLGRCVGENRDGVAEGKTGVKCRGPESWPACMRFHGAVEDVPLPEAIPPKTQSQMRFLNRGALLGFAATVEAVRGAAVDLSSIPVNRRALYMGTGDYTLVGYSFMHQAVKEASKGGFRSLDQARLNRSALSNVNPFYLLESIANNPFSFISAWFECMGPGTSLSFDSPSGLNALDLACRALSQGRADAAIALGCGSWVNEATKNEMQGLGILSHGREGAASFRPFDRRRNGFFPGEGGAAVFLETLSSARARGAGVWGVVRGIGNALDVGVGPCSSIPPARPGHSVALALEQSDTAVECLSFICPHASATHRGDAAEMEALAGLARGGHLPPIVGLKPYTGHMGAASDLGEVILSILAARAGLVPPTPHLVEVEKTYAHLPFTTGCQTVGLGPFLSVSNGIGGQSVAVVVEPGTAL